MEKDLRLFTAALRCGDEGAWRDFHDTYYPRVFRWLLALSHGDEEAAKEAAHLTFLRAVRRVPHTGDAGELWRWMTRVARCAYIDEWRKRRSQGSLLRRCLDHMEPPDVLSVETNPHELLDECLRSLAEADRFLLEEKYFSGLSTRDLASGHNVSEKALESRLTRARDRLREAFSRRLHNENRS